MVINDKSFLITGSARRIGRAIALDIAKSGANIAVHYRSSESEAKSLVEEASALGVRAAGFQADLTSAGDVIRLVRESKDYLGSLDGVVAAAAVFKKTPWAGISEADWDFHIDANLKSTFLLAKEASKVMSNGSSFVTIGDWSGLRAYENYLPYCVSKAGVIALTKALALELAPRIRVNCVCPGTVLPPEHVTESVVESIRGKTPLARIGDPADVVASVRFLIEGTDFATGTVLVIDGGRLIANPGYG